MFRNVPYKLQLQILRFGVKPSIYLCFGTECFQSSLKEWNQKWNYRKRNWNCGAYGVYESERYTGKGEIFFCSLRSIISEIFLPFSPLSITVLPGDVGQNFELIFGSSFFFLTTLSNHSLHLDYSGYLAIQLQFLICLTQFRPSSVQCCSIITVFIYSFS